MGKQLAGSFIFTIEAFRMTKNGGCKMTLNISEQEAPKALALAMVPDALYTNDVFILENETFGSKEA